MQGEGAEPSPARQLVIAAVLIGASVVLIAVSGLLAMTMFLAATEDSPHQNADEIYGCP